MFDQISLSPQLKGSMFPSNKDGIYELPHKLPKDVRVRILENSEKSKFRISSSYSLVLSLPFYNGNFVYTSKTILKNRN